MPTVEVAVVIKKPAAEVYRVLKNLEDFPRFMADVKNVKIIKRQNGTVVTAWEVDIEGAPVSWKEEDIFDDGLMQLKFSMVEGNYQMYRGLWQVQAHAHGAVLSLKADFEWGIPILEQYVGGVLEDKARRGLFGMLLAIKKRVEK